MYENDEGKFVTVSYKIKNTFGVKTIFGLFKINKEDSNIWMFINIKDPNTTKTFTLSEVIIIDWHAEEVREK